MDLYYKHSRGGCPVHGTQYLAGNKENLPRFGLDDGRLKKVLNEIKQSGRLVNENLFQYTTGHLHQGVEQGMGKLDPDDPAFEKYLNMLRNTARFSAYKTAHQVYDLRRKAIGHNNEWAIAKAIDRRYNTNWLRTEYAHTVRSARMAKKWQQFQADKDIYPNLEYMPSRAAEPRNEHKKLYGIIKPLDDPFWDVWLPPNDWGCKCSVRQTRKEPGGKVPKIKQPPAVMRHNPGKTGQIFSDGHPMIKRVSDLTKKSIEVELEYLKKWVPYKKIYHAKGNIFLHPFSDKADRKQNIAFAKGFADQHKADLYIKEHLDKNKLIIFNQKYPGIINPDKIKNNEFVLIYNRKKYQGDLATQKSNNPVRVIENAFKHKFGFNKNKTPKQLQPYKQTFLAIDLKKVHYNKDTYLHISATLEKYALKIQSLKVVVLKIEQKYFLLNEKIIRNRESIFNKIYKKRTK